MGQIIGGLEGLKYTGKGIELMKTEREKYKPEDSDYFDLTAQMIAALCSCAEIYLTDACFEENAETMCEKFVVEALNLDPTSKHPEALMTLASLRMSQQKPDDALQAMNKCYDIFKDEEIYEKRPAFEFRHNAAKIFMELNEPLKASEIWESLLEEDDTIAEVYYHLGLAYRTLSTKNSLECLNKSKELLVASNCQDATLLKQIDDIISEVSKENIETFPPEDEDMGDGKQEAESNNNGKASMEM